MFSPTLVVSGAAVSDFSDTGFEMYGLHFLRIHCSVPYCCTQASNYSGQGITVTSW
jgi:hypothetical protein